MSVACGILDGEETERGTRGRGTSWRAGVGDDLAGQQPCCLPPKFARRFARRFQDFQTTGWAHYPTRHRRTRVQHASDPHSPHTRPRLPSTLAPRPTPTHAHTGLPHGPPRTLAFYRAPASHAHSRLRSVTAQRAASPLHTPLPPAGLASAATRWPQHPHTSTPPPALNHATNHATYSGRPTTDGAGTTRHAWWRAYARLVDARSDGASLEITRDARSDGASTQEDASIPPPHSSSLELTRDHSSSIAATRESFFSQ